MRAAGKRISIQLISAPHNSTPFENLQKTYRIDIGGRNFKPHSQPTNIVPIANERRNIGRMEGTYQNPTFVANNNRFKITISPALSNGELCHKRGATTLRQTIALSSYTLTSGGRNFLYFVKSMLSPPVCCTPVSSNVYHT